MLTSGEDAIGDEGTGLDDEDETSETTRHIHSSSAEDVIPPAKRP